MAAKRSKRARFGNVRTLPSGRFQARYTDKAGRRHVAPETFGTESAAWRWLSTVETDLARGAWVDPEGGRLTLAEYGDEWLDLRPDLRPRTLELYRGLLARYIEPPLGAVRLADLSPSLVRSWHADLTRTAPPSIPPKAYRLLRAMLNTATADELIVRNPAAGLKGAGVERSAERPIATPVQVWALADAIEPRFRALVLLAAFTGLRFGELAGLARRHVDLGGSGGQVVDLDARRRRAAAAAATVTVERQVVEDRGRRFFGPPKSDAGRRTVAIPSVLVPELVAHFERFAEPGPDGLVFVGSRGGMLARGNFHPKWAAARDAVIESHDLPADFHPHDLRHTSNTLAAATGASTRELMRRMGHASPAAALRYQHATDDRDAEIAEALGQALRRPAAG